MTTSLSVPPEISRLDPKLITLGQTRGLYFKNITDSQCKDSAMSQGLSKLVTGTDYRKDTSLLRNLSIFRKLRIRNTLQYKPHVILDIVSLTKSREIVLRGTMFSLTFQSYKTVCCDIDLIRTYYSFHLRCIFYAIS